MAGEFWCCCFLWYRLRLTCAKHINNQLISLLNVFELFQADINFYSPGWQITAASSEWPQSLMPQPLNLQLTNEVSVPTHSTSSMRICPVPCPNEAIDSGAAPELQDHQKSLTV